jgi:hypothetical protein
MRLIGKKGSIETFPIAQIKRVRLLRRADGYYVQFAVQTDRHLTHAPTGKQVDIDVGLKAFYTDSEGTTVDHPRYLRKAERKLKRWHLESRTQKSKGAPAMAMLAGLPRSPSFPSGRYVHTNPLRREGGLRLLAASLPDPLYLFMRRAWRHVTAYDGREAIQNPHRQLPSEAQLACLSVQTLWWLLLAELEASVRFGSLADNHHPRGALRLLILQSEALRRLYVALAAQLGGAGAQTEFARLLRAG